MDKFDGNKERVQEECKGMGVVTSSIFPYEASRSVPLNIKTDLDFEAQPVHTMTLTITDVSQRTATQSITIKLIDQNEAPVLRKLDDPSSEADASPAIYKTFTVKEDAASNFEIGELVAWDPDVGDLLSFTVSGADNNGDVFGVLRTDRISAGAGATGKMTVAALELRNAGSIDYETKQLYVLDLTVSDGLLEDTAKVQIEINNVNDVTVEDVTVESSGEKILQTDGDETVHITGTNFGIKYGSDTALKSNVKVTYGRLDKDRATQWFTATGCAVDSAATANTLIVCKSAAGFGEKLVWNVEVRRESTGASEGLADTSLTTSYATPTITSIELQGGGAADNLNTRGDTQLVLTGTNFGSAGSLEGYYTADPAAGWYHAKNCMVTVAHTKATCNSVAGIGQDMVWKFEKVDYEWLGSTSAASVITSYQAPSITDVANCALCSAATGRKEFTTHGNQDVYITGDNFGPLADSANSQVPADPGAITVSYSNSLGYSYHQQLRCEVVTAHTQIKCKTVAGVSKDFVWKVTVAGQSSPESSSADMTFYTPPVITSLTGPGAYNANTAGGQKFYIEGDFFGPASNCRGSSSFGQNCIDNVIFATTDTDDPVLKQEFKGVDCIVQNAQTLIICTSPEGVGKNFAYKVSVGTQMSVLNVDLVNEGTNARPSYGRPVLSTLLRSEGISLSSSQNMNDADTRGFTVNGNNKLYDGGVVPETILITGSNFGPINSGRCFQTGRSCMVNLDCFNAASEGNTCDSSGAVTWNPTTAVYKTTEESFTAGHCHVVTSHTKMKCDFIAGAGKFHEWIVTVGKQISLTPTTSYHPPQLHQITGEGAMNGDTSGNQIVVLNGLNFGPYSNGSVVSYGVTGMEYSPTNCVVVSHQKITCMTVPGIGQGLFWRVTVREQTNELTATSSYAAPNIHSITPAIASADGSDTREFLAFLNVSNSGLADPLSNIVVQFDPACKIDIQDACGPYEIPVEPVSSVATRSEGAFDILAFRVPMLKNQKNAKDIAVSIVVFPSDRTTGDVIRNVAVKSENVVLFSYSEPTIDQIVVTEHPWISGMRVLTVIGRNFGSISIGKDPKLEYAMKVNNIPLTGGVANVLPMQLNVDIRKFNRTTTFVQKWERGAQNERHDEIVVIWAGTNKGKISVSRGGVSSNEVEFEDLTPSIIGKLRAERVVPGQNSVLIKAVPTLGSKVVNVLEGNDEIRIEINCKDCGTSQQMCCTDSTKTSCETKCHPTNQGIPKLVEIWLGSSQLPDSELQQCPIIEGSSRYNEETKQWKYNCQVPPYQGSTVDTRIKFDGRWSNAASTRYMAPTIETLSFSVGGTKGSSTGFTGDQIIVAVTDENPLLLVRTNGERIKITGKNFGKPFAGDITNYNKKNVVYKDAGNIEKWRPDIEDTPYHGGWSVQIPSGTSSLPRSIDVQVGQYQVDLQSTVGGKSQVPPDTTTMFVAYRKPTLVNELVPLWRYNQNNRAGGFEVTIYGYDFMTSSQARSAGLGLQGTVVWFRAEFNRTSEKFEGTPCKIISTTYTKIVCKVENLIPTKTRSVEDDVAIAVTVDGQTTVGYMSESDVTASKNAVSAGLYTQDEALIKQLTDDRDQRFTAQVDLCMERSGGLTPALRAYFLEPSSTEDAQNEQDVAFKTEANSLTLRQAKIQECVSVVVTAFNKACSNTQTIESAAVLKAAYLKDESEGITNSRSDIVCAITGSPPNTESTGSTGNGPTGRPTNIAGGGSGIAAPGGDVATPAVVNIKCAADVRKLQTSGGNLLFVKTQGLTIEYNFRAYLVDEAGEFPPIPVKGGVSGKNIIQPQDYKPGLIFGNLTLRVPPGQGKQRRLILESDAKFGGLSLKSDRGQTLDGTVGYGAPWINKTSTPLPVRTSTDSCLPNQYESPLSWTARVENLRGGFVDGVKLDADSIEELDSQMFDRRCLKYDTVELNGLNFGAETSQLKVWVEGSTFLKGESAISSERELVFWIYNGTAFTTKKDVYSDILNRGFAGESVSFTLIHMHDRLILRGPRGYGKACTLHVQVADQTVVVPFSFKSPIAEYSAPRAYDARGQNIVIHGQNFGGVVSTAIVNINGYPCDNALWNRQHEEVGLPYISCTARETIAGVANISLFVAGQHSSFVITEILDTAGVRTICQESKNEVDLDLETGKALGYWGRREPVGELCAPCQAGSLCNQNSYDNPMSLAGYYMVELDISNKVTNQEEEEDIVTRRERRDYDRALEKFQNNGKRICPEERLFDPEVDAERVKNFPYAASTKRELCLTAMPCKPSEACKGRNECAEGYQYQELRCNASSKRRLSGEEIVQSCNHTLQCQTLSAGTGCTNAISTVCKCPFDWELGTRTCLKECVQNQLPELEAAGCTLGLLQKSLSGKSCDYNKPEDCAVCESERMCVTRDGINTGVACSNRGDCVASAGFSGTCEKRGQCKCGPSSRCVVCTAGTHYRDQAGKCEACPKNMTLVFVMFFVGICFVILGAYILDQKRKNLAFMIIPMDYFQVLALLSRADIRWPQLLLTMLKALQFFNFNLDIATPECLLAGVFSYEMKYYATLLVAPTIVLFLVLAFCWHQIYRRCCLKRDPDKLYSSKLVGTFMLLIYCVYLSCTTRALEVFNCSPTVPDDGWEYVSFTDQSCDGGGLCRCWDSEHLPYKLMLPSLLSIAIYTLGFPLILFWLLRCGKRKDLLKEDQILRANDLGDSLASNPRAYHLRVRYHKMYYYYKPGKSYWMLVILARKVGIAFCSLIFRTNPGFMLASVVLILFIAFSMQTKHSPYMSASQRQIVLAEHSIKAEAGDLTHMYIRDNIQHVKNAEKQNRRGKAGRTKQQLSTIGKAKAAKKKKAIAFFFDYNTVELVLLFCAVIICLAGVMFESDRFKVTNESGNLRYSWQRDVVTFLVIFIVMSSFVYLAIVMANEITGYTPQFLRKCCQSKQSAMMSAADTIQNVKDDQIEMSIMNPAMINSYVFLLFFFGRAVNLSS